MNMNCSNLYTWKYAVKTITLKASNQNRCRTCISVLRLTASRMSSNLQYGGQNIPNSPNLLDAKTNMTTPDISVHPRVRALIYK